MGYTILNMGKIKYCVRHKNKAKIHKLRSVPLRLYQRFLSTAFFVVQKQNAASGKESSQEGNYLSKSCHIKNGIKPFNISLPPSGKKSQVLTQHIRSTLSVSLNLTSGSILISNLCYSIKLLAFPPNNSLLCTRSPICLKVLLLLFCLTG